MDPTDAARLERFRDPTEFVAKGYDRASQRYAEAALRTSGIRERYTELVLDRLAVGSSVLDLGCGTGVPTTARLAERFDVTGVEVSAVQLGRAKRAVPEARFLRADMSRLELAGGRFDAVVAFYSIIHVPRQRQQTLLNSILFWLRPGGLLVASLATTGSETWIEDDFFGAPMYWSSFDAETNERMVEEAGFDLESAEIVAQTFDGEDESHLWIVARRPV